MSQLTSGADARLAGLDPARLRELDAFLDRLTQDGRIPGWSIRVSRRSVLAHAASAERIFAPLGMDDTAFTVPAADRGRLAQLYAVTPAGGLVPAPALAQTIIAPGRGHFGGGGLASTAGDYLRFAMMLANRGTLDGVRVRVRVLGRPTVDLMVANHLPGGADLRAFGRPMNAESPLSGVGQGLGLSVLLDPALAGYPGSPGEFGWGGAASTVFWADRALYLLVVFMTQALPAAALPIRGKLHELVMRALA